MYYAFCAFCNIHVCCTKEGEKYTHKKVQISILINRKETACVGFHVNITNTTPVYIESFPICSNSNYSSMYPCQVWQKVQA